jgi:chromosome segregation ATPase
MFQCVCIGGLIVLADGAAWILTAETGDSRWVVIITSVTGIIVAFCTMIVMIAPHVSKAAPVFSNMIVTAILPALAVIRKHNEELNKGTLTEKLEDALHLLKKAEAERAEASLKLAETNERLETLAEQNLKLSDQNVKLQATIEDDRASTDKARKTLHDIRGEFQVATLQHREQREALIAQIGALTESLEAARREIAEFHAKEDAKLHIVASGQARQDAAIETNAADIERLKQGSGELQVDKIDP